MKRNTGTSTSSQLSAALLPPRNPFSSKNPLFKGWWSMPSEKPPTHLSYRAKKQWLRERSAFLAREDEAATLALYREQGIEFNPEIELRMDGGLGRYSLVTTVLGVTWTTVRAASAFALSVRIVCGSNDTFPSPIGLVILMLSAQTYCVSRAMPRFTYVVLALDLLMIYGALVLTTYGLVSDKDKYAKIGVDGGTCPYYSSYPCSQHDPSRIGSRIGCDASLAATWMNDMHDYPPDQDGTFTGTVDPSGLSAPGILHIWYLQTMVGFLGSIAGLITVCTTPCCIHMSFYECKPRRPLPVLKLARYGRLCYTPQDCLSSPY